MLLLKDEFDFLTQVARDGGQFEVPSDFGRQLIVQILVSFRLLRLAGDHLELTDRGRQVLVLGRRRRQGVVVDGESAARRGGHVRMDQRLE